MKFFIDGITPSTVKSVYRDIAEINLDSCLDVDTLFKITLFNLSFLSKFKKFIYVETMDKTFYIMF